MAETVITTPLDAGTPFATDMVDLGAGAANVQHVKLIDGREGGTDGMAVGPDGELTVAPASAWYPISTGFGGELALGEASYAAGEQLSDGADSSALPPGVYRFGSVKLLSSMGTALPDGIGVAFTPFTNASPPTWGNDGDAYAPPASLEALYAQWVRDFATPTDQDTIRVSLAPTVIALDGGADRIRITPFTTDAIPSVAGSEALILVAYLERLGSFVT